MTEIMPRSARAEDADHRQPAVDRPGELLPQRGGVHAVESTRAEDGDDRQLRVLECEGLPHRLREQAGEGGVREGCVHELQAAVCEQWEWDVRLSGRREPVPDEEQQLSHLVCECHRAVQRERGKRGAVDRRHPEEGAEEEGICMSVVISLFVGCSMRLEKLSSSRACSS